MATRAEVDAYQHVIDGLSSVAYAQLKALLLSIDDPSPVVFRDALLAGYPDLVAPFLSASAEISAQWYSDLRAATRPTKPFTPKAVGFPPEKQLDTVVRYSLTPLFAPAGSSFIGSDILSLLAGATQKLIANQGRNTIETNAYADPVRVGWARVPQPGCCAFCGMLASRGAVYSSAAAAGDVVGRGVDTSVTAGKAGGQGKGIKVRGSQGLGNKYHAHCRCVAVPVFPDGDNSLIQQTADHFSSLYVQTDGLVQNSDGYLVTDLQQTLSSWRHEHGTK